MNEERGIRNELVLKFYGEMADPPTADPLQRRAGALGGVAI